jgi:hypothetical protein
MTIPHLELIEDPNKKNDFIIFRHQIKGKKVPGFSKKVNLSSKKTRKHRKIKTRKHKRKKSFFNIF